MTLRISAYTGFAKNSKAHTHMQVEYFEGSYILVKRHVLSHYGERVNTNLAVTGDTLITLAHHLSSNKARLL